MNDSGTRITLRWQSAREAYHHPLSEVEHLLQRNQHRRSEFLLIQQPKAVVRKHVARHYITRHAAEAQTQVNWCILGGRGLQQGEESFDSVVD